jgi:hypothetical protein
MKIQANTTAFGGQLPTIGPKTKTASFRLKRVALLKGALKLKADG